jgi:hypothetical protein
VTPRREGNEDLVARLQALECQVLSLKARVQVLWVALLVGVAVLVPVALVRAGTTSANVPTRADVVRARLFVVTDENGEDRAELGFGSSPLERQGGGTVAPHLTLLDKGGGGSVELTAGPGGSALFLGGGDLYSIGLFAHANGSEARFLGGGGSAVLRHDASSNDLGFTMQHGPAVVLSNVESGSGLVFKDATDKDRIAILGVGGTSLVQLSDEQGATRVVLGVRKAKAAPTSSELLLYDENGAVTFEAPKE